MNFIKSEYPGPPFLLRNGHVETIYAATFRNIPTFTYTRERKELPDGDFIDLDWHRQDSNKLVILIHGLEGNSTRHYVMSMAHIFQKDGYDILGWNARSCSGEINRNFRLYSHADVEDLTLVIDELISNSIYDSIHLVGSSMGGNMVIKYAGTQGKKLLDSPIKSIVAISTPLDLEATAKNLDRPINYIFRKKFYDRLKKKVLVKAKQFPGRLDLKKLEDIENWEDFDDAFSAPLGGFKNAKEFYFQGSGMNFLNDIPIPCLILNSQNDPILSTESLDLEQNKEISNDNIIFEKTLLGGHVGYLLSREQWTWADLRAYEFITKKSRNLIMNTTI